MTKLAVALVRCGDYDPVRVREAVRYAVQSSNRTASCTPQIGLDGCVATRYNCTYEDRRRH